MTRGCGFSGGCRIGEVFLQEPSVHRNPLYWRNCTYSAMHIMQMKRKTKVTEAAAAKAGRTTRRKMIALMASVEQPKNAHGAQAGDHTASGRRRSGLVQKRAARLANQDQSGAARGDFGTGEEIVEMRSGAFWVCGGPRPPAVKLPLKPKAGLRWATRHPCILRTKPSDAIVCATHSSKTAGRPIARLTA